MRALLARYKKESAAANQRDAKMFKTMFAKLAKLPDSDAAAGPKVAAAAAAPVSGAEPADGLASHPVEVADGGGMEAGEAAEPPELQHGAAQQNGHAHTQDAPLPMAVDSVA